MGITDKELDVNKPLTTEKREIKRSISLKVTEKHPTRSAILGILAALVLLAIVAVIAVADYEWSRKDDTVNENIGCGTYSYKGINISDLTPKIVTQDNTCNIDGDCWVGEQCYECFRLDNWQVGSINGVPVCCPKCAISELALSNNSCNCLVKI